MNDNDVRNTSLEADLTPQQTLIVRRLYTAIEHAAKALAMMNDGVAVTVLATAYLQGDNNEMRPVTVGATTAHGAQSALQHMEGSERVVIEAHQGIRKRIAEDEAKDTQKEA